MPNSQVLQQAERVNALLMDHMPELAGLLVPVVISVCVNTFNANFEHCYPVAQSGGAR